jgi:hypothetical protein
MIDFKKFVLATATVATTALTTCATAQPSFAAENCFEGDSNLSVVKTSLTTSQVNYIRRFTLAGAGLDNVVTRFGLKNRIQQCLNEGKKLNGLTKVSETINPPASSPGTVWQSFKLTKTVNTQANGYNRFFPVDAGQVINIDTRQVNGVATSVGIRFPGEAYGS